MNEAMENNQVQTCPQCDNHCPINALQCGRGRKYFGVTDSGEHEHGHGREHGHGCGHKQLSGLPGLLHQCGRFVRHADMDEIELFQVLTDEEKTALQTLLGKLSADWQTRFGRDGMDCRHHGHGGHDGEKHHYEHEGHGK